MYDQAPGNILLNMYLKARLKKLMIPETFFCEVGSGNGHISNILLRFGLKGIGFDLNEEACENNMMKNYYYIENGFYKIENVDFIDAELLQKVDIIISSMVIEHLPDNLLDEYFRKCKEILKKNGLIITLVPASMKHWGIEDEIAGHYKRYKFEDFETIAQQHSLKITHIAGLTYPLSNLLLRLSNYLVKKNESYKKNLSRHKQTVLSGSRKVRFKTHFPTYFRFFLNELVLYPFFVLQKIFTKNKNSLVIYCELIRADN